MSAASGRRTLTLEHSRGSNSRPGTAALSLRSAWTGVRAPAIAQSRGRRRPEAGSSRSRSVPIGTWGCENGKGLRTPRSRDVLAKDILAGGRGVSIQ